MSSQPNLDTLYMQANQMRAELNVLRRVVDGMTSTAARDASAPADTTLAEQVASLQQRVAVLEAPAAS